MSARLVLAGLGFVATLFSQQSTQQSNSWTLDASGHRVEGNAVSIVESPSGSQRMETTRSVNGRTIPIQSAEDRVLRQDAQSKVVERTIRKYDPNGNAGRPIKMQVEETKNPDGSTTIRSTSYEADVNGNFQLFERATTQIRKGAATETSTTVERAGPNGSLQTLERSTSVERPAGGGSQIDSTIYRRDVSGNLVPVAQDVKRISKSGAEETVDAAHYEMDQSGKMSLASRAVDHVKTNPDGSQVTDTEAYSQFMAGRTGDANTAEPRLQEQVHRERTAPAGGTVLETTSTRARLPNDPSRFGPYEKTTQTTYTSADASGKEIKSTTTSLDRRDVNGQFIQEQGRTEQSVTPKKK